MANDKADFLILGTYLCDDIPSKVRVTKIGWPNSVFSLEKMVKAIEEEISLKVSNKSDSNGYWLCLEIKRFPS
jgi:hypothetical protein